MEPMWIKIYRERSRSLWLIARGIVKDSDTADEVVQSVLFSLAQKDLSAVENIAGFLHRCVTNAALDVLRRRKSELKKRKALRKQVSHPAADSDMDNTAGEPEMFEATTHNDIMSGDIEYYMNMVRRMLTKSEYKVYELWKDGYSRETMADTLNLSENTVHTHVTNFMSKLKRLLRSLSG